MCTCTSTRYCNVHSSNHETFQDLATTRNYIFQLASQPTSSTMYLQPLVALALLAFIARIHAEASVRALPSYQAGMTSTLLRYFCEASASTNEKMKRERGCPNLLSSKRRYARFGSGRCPGKAEQMAQKGNLLIRSSIACIFLMSEGHCPVPAVAQVR